MALSDAYSAASDPQFYGRCKLAFKALALQVLAETTGPNLPQRKSCAQAIVGDQWPATRLGDMVCSDGVTLSAATDAEIAARASAIFDVMNGPSS